MAVSEKLILELQKIIKAEYGREPSIAEVSEIANGLVGYFDLLLKIDRRNENNKKNKKSI
ncbi:MAG: hypothetical protein RBS77_02955 [Candidatus Moranbacteria bacterium]|jgi:hypothetical protein|nr:hypothetical protein [Candidatus Moranbacteria bacterium]